MALKKWQPNAIKRKQVNTITVSGTPAAGNFAEVSINGKEIRYTVVTDDTTTTVASNLADLLRSAEDGEFQMIVWTSSAAVITATAAVAGEPFTATGSGVLTVNSTGGGATTLTAVSVETNSSPNDVANVDNWSGGTLPVDTDTIIVEDTQEGMYWNLSALNTVTVASFKVRESFSPSARTCWIGNPTINPNFNFREFRGVELALEAATILEINLSESAGAGCIRLNTGSTAMAGKITGQGSVGLGSEQVHWRGTGINNSWEVFGGSLLIAPQLFDPTATAVVQTISALQGTITMDSGVTVNTSVTMRDSVLDTRVSIPSLSINGESQAIVRDAATCTNLIIDQGTVFWNSTGTISNIKGGSGGAIDFSSATEALTVGSGTGTVVLDEGFVYGDREKRTIASWAADTVLCSRTGFGGVIFDVGDHFYIKLSAGP